MWMCFSLLQSLLVLLLKPSYLWPEESLQSWPLLIIFNSLLLFIAVDKANKQRNKQQVEI